MLHHSEFHIEGVYGIINTRWCQYQKQNPIKTRVQINKQKTMNGA